MKYYIGIDGGGSKTVFALSDESGRILAQHRSTSADYKQITIPGVIILLEEGIHKLEELSGVCLKLDECATCFGMPMFGEILKNDKQVLEGIAMQLSHYHIQVVNDVEVGWSGSLLGEAGINIVAGTGSIAYGQDEYGNSGKAGGWSEFFSDEGSGNWLGIRTIEYFSKEADGRLQKGPLYDIVRRHFSLKEDIDIIPIFEEEYMPDRGKRASLQLLLKEAAEAGDENAIYLYRQAAFELSLMVGAVYDKLKFKNNAKVSYSGGLFDAGDFIKRPFLAFIKELGLRPVSPKGTPVEGALLLAKRYQTSKRDSIL